MKLTETQTKKLMEHRGKLEIKQLVLSLAVTKNRLNYSKDKSISSLSSITRDLNMILEKYGATAQADYKSITSL
ncbi:MAG: hypothetical protein LBS84_13070 [Clostridiales bacterium]|jgi:hypothetical protein|nr:hypothetical protein [Clostridiales bacterium]